MPSVKRQGVATVVAVLAVLAWTGPWVAQERAWYGLEDGLQRAYEQERPMLVYVRAPWCGPCYRLEAEVFPELEALLRGVVLVKIDLADRPAPGEAAGRREFEWIRHQGLETPPAFAVLAPDGTPQVVLRGFMPADRLRRILLQALELDTS